MTKKRGARPPTASVSPIEAAFRSSEAAREYMSKRGRQASDVAGFVRSLKIASELVTAETRRAEQRTAFHETMAGIERLRASGVAVVAMIGEAAAMPFVGMAVELIDGIVPDDVGRALDRSDVKIASAVLLELMDRHRVNKLAPEVVAFALACTYSRIKGSGSPSYREMAVIEVVADAEQSLDDDDEIETRIEAWKKRVPKGRGTLDEEDLFARALADGAWRSVVHAGGLLATAAYATPLARKYGVSPERLVAHLDDFMRAHDREDDDRNQGSCRVNRYAASRSVFAGA